MDVQRLASGTVAAPYAGGWHHYDVVVHEDGTRIYTDGVLTATTPVSKKISEVLGDNSIFNIGKPPGAAVNSVRQK